MKKKGPAPRPAQRPSLAGSMRSLPAPPKIASKKHSVPRSSSVPTVLRSKPSLVAPPRAVTSLPPRPAIGRLVTNKIASVAGRLGRFGSKKKS
jgi:hypothetical protein